MTLATLLTLAAVGRWRPFLDPLPLDEYYLLFLVPLVIGIAVVYKTIKVEDLSQLPKAASVLTVQILTFLALSAVALWVITAWV